MREIKSFMEAIGSHTDRRTGTDSNIARTTIGQRAEEEAFSLAIARNSISWGEPIIINPADVH